MALIRSARCYERARFDAACRRAIDIGSPTRKSVLAILNRGLDAAAMPDLYEPKPAPTHDNIRGGAYYDKKGLPTRIRGRISASNALGGLWICGASRRSPSESRAPR